MNKPVNNASVLPCRKIRGALLLAVSIIMTVACASNATVNLASGKMEISGEVFKGCESGKEEACAMVAKEIRQHDKSGVKDNYGLYMEYAKKGKHNGAADVLSCYLGPCGQDIQQADLDWALSVDENYCLNENLGRIEITKRMCDLAFDTKQKLGFPNDKTIKMRLCQLGWVAECREAGVR